MSTMKNAFDIELIEPIGEVTDFNSDLEREEFIEKYNMNEHRSKKQQQENVWYYKTKQNKDELIRCELKGYIKHENGFETLVVIFEDGTEHCVLHLYLATMQNKKFKFEEVA
jgi:hypothetical protein